TIPRAPLSTGPAPWGPDGARLRMPPNCKQRLPWRPRYRASRGQRKPPGSITDSARPNRRDDVKAEGGRGEAYPRGRRTETRTFIFSSATGMPHGILVNV